ncbi:hypothetical protein [Paraburkholderia aspalathi]|uniref:hypothetical protein n=1 Tax=Paraburkholderia aspalathi TaxID=1324617 RepID=UPI0038B87B46
MNAPSALVELKEAFGARQSGTGAFENRLRIPTEKHFANLIDLADIGARVERLTPDEWKGLALEVEPGSQTGQKKLALHIAGKEPGQEQKDQSGGLKFSGTALSVATGPGVALSEKGLTVQVHKSKVGDIETEDGGLTTAKGGLQLKLSDQSGLTTDPNVEPKGDGLKVNPGAGLKLADGVLRTRRGKGFHDGDMPAYISTGAGLTVTKPDGILGVRLPDKGYLTIDFQGRLNIDFARLLEPIPVPPPPPPALNWVLEGIYAGILKNGGQCKKVATSITTGDKIALVVTGVSIRDIKLVKDWTARFHSDTWAEPINLLMTSDAIVDIELDQKPAIGWNTGKTFAECGLRPADQGDVSLNQPESPPYKKHEETAEKITVRGG